MSCVHDPKTSKIHCIVNHSEYEFLVCRICRNDPDLDNSISEILINPEVIKN